MDEENVIYRQLNFNTAIKKSEILSFAGKWMEMENIILCEVSQSQKAKIQVYRTKTILPILWDIGHTKQRSFMEK
jgi:hypothetical protein